MWLGGGREQVAVSRLGEAVCREQLGQGLGLLGPLGIAWCTQIDS